MQHVSTWTLLSGSIKNKDFDYVFNYAYEQAGLCLDQDYAEK
jgi:hypothetical protein